MTNIQNPNSKFDLEDRTLDLAKKTIRLCLKLNENIVNSKIIDQLVRLVGSIGANYREANDSLGKKDFIHRLRISRKETKETIFWLELLIEPNPSFISDIKVLIDESTQIRNILSAIITKIKLKND